MNTATRILSVTAVLLLVLSSPRPATAQYFGQNKVQYDEFDWRVIATDRFDLHFYQDEEASLQMARAAERWRSRLSRVFQHELTGTKPVVMYANHPDFQQTNIIRGEIGLGTGGVTDAARNRATQPWTGDFHGTAHVVGHELVHVFQYDIATSGPAGVRGMARLPLWAIEGMAEYLSVGREDPHTAMWMRDAVLREDIPTIQGLSSGRYFPYRYGQALLAYVGGRWGDLAVTRLYRVGLERGLEAAIQEVTGLTSEELSEAWAEELRRTYGPVLEGRQAPDDVGRPLFAEGDRRGDVNLAPVLSPDGRNVAFISERGLFSMDLYVADVQTGEVVRRLTSSERAPHFDALSFLESAGSWSPDGRYFAYVVVDDGDNEIRIADLGGNDGARSIEVPEVQALNDPAWSPDGDRLAFSGSSGSTSDLYLHDLASGRTTRLTSGLHADLQPAWSPDGGSLVFVTDRGTDTSLDALAFGRFRLASLDVQARRIELLPSFPGAKHVDPHFAPDGRSVYFVSDRDGVSDVFRLDLSTGDFYRVTRTATGVSGVTAHSPALSVSARTGALAFSVFTDNEYRLRVLDPEQGAGTRVTGGGSLVPAGVLPPVRPVAGAGESIVSAYLDAPLEGLPPTGVRYAISEYDPSLGLEYIGPPMVGASVDQFGTTIGGAVSFQFGDLLGDRRLGVLAQAQGELQDLGGQVFYEDREDRLNWGVIAGRVPYRSGQRAVERVSPGGQQALLVRDRIFRTFVNQAGAQVAYPFSRARRVEAQVSFTRYTFGAEERQFLCDPSGASCEQLGEVDLEELERPAVNLYQTNAAYVGDWTNFGFTGPVAGGRFRFEIEPTFGDLQFTSALADYRRYFFWRPVTLAVRGLHYGRYGQDSEDRQFLTPLFLGSGDLVRGYSTRSFRSSECSGMSGGDGCPEFDRLIGSRIGVGSLELRLPLFGTEDFGLVSFPFLPTTIGAFFDAGVAWTSDEGPELDFATRSTERIPVTSTGVFARANVLGYVVVSTWFAHPFQRPEEDWTFGFQLAPGW